MVLNKQTFTIQEKELAKRNMRDDMVLFGRVLLKDTFYQEIPKFHKEIYDAIQSTDYKDLHLLIVAPRGHAKTTIAGLVAPLHHLFFFNNKGKNKNIVLVSRTQRHAIRILNTIKNELNYNPMIKYFFGDYSEKTAYKWAETEIILKDNTIITALGTGQQIRGIKHLNVRPTLTILDDPEDQDNTRTKDAMDQTLIWVLGDCIPIVDDPFTSKIIVIGTVVHRNCLVNRLKDMENFRVLWYKAIQDDGTVLWEDRRPLSWLLNEKKAYASIGKLSIWYMEYQNEIVAPETQPFKEEYFRYHEYTLECYPKYHYAQLVSEKNGKTIRKPVNVYMGIDPASSVEDTADSSAIFVIAIDHYKNVYCIDYFKGRVHPMNLIEKIKTYYSNYSPKGVDIETVGYQEMLRDYFRTNRIFMPGIERKNQPRTSKSRRLLSLQPMFAQGRVFLKKGMSEFMEELLNYNPERNNNDDDLLDGFYYANKNAVPPLKTEGVENVVQLKKEEKVHEIIDWRML